MGWLRSLPTVQLLGSSEWSVLQQEKKTKESRRKDPYIVGIPDRSHDELGAQPHTPNASQGDARQARFITLKSHSRVNNNNNNNSFVS